MKPILLFIFAILFLSTSTLFLRYYQENQSQENTINNRNFFKKWGKQAHNNQSASLKSSIGISDDMNVPSIITYGMNFKIEADNQNTSENIDEINVNSKITAQCDIQTIYDEEQNIFDVAISYTMIDRHNLKNQNLQQAQNIFDVEDGYREIDIEEIEVLQIEEQQNYFYLVKVEADSGEVLSIKIEQNYEEDALITYATQQLINDIFPEMRKGSYLKGDIVSDNLGEVHIDYIQEEIDENSIAITKEFNSGDYIKLEIPELNVPEVDYERVSIVDKNSGLVQEGVTEYKFVLGDSNEEEMKLQSSNEENYEMELEVLGQISGEIISNFWIVEPTQQDTMIAQEMYRYRNSGQFENKRLASEMKAQIEYGNGNEEQFEFQDFNVENEIIEINDDILENTDQPSVQFGGLYDNSQQQEQLLEGEQEILKLGSGAQTFQDVKELGSASILGNKIVVELVYTGYTQVSNVSIKVKVGSHYIADIISGNFNNCQASSKQNAQQKSITFFKATFPILGIIVVPVSAAGVFNYGYNTSVTTGPRYCGFNLNPYMSVGLYADGQISLAGLISAGIYAQGTFLNSSLNLDVVTQAGKSSSTLSGAFHGIEFEMGATYTKISCSLSNIKRNLNQNEFEVDEDMEQISEQQNRRRNLGLRKAFKKVTQPIKKAVHVVAPVIQQVAKVAERAVEIASNLHKICSTSKGSVLIAKTSSAASNKILWSKSVNIGI